MEMKLGHAADSGRKAVLLWPVYLCFLVFGLMIPFTRPDFQAMTFVYSLLLSLAVGLLAVKLLLVLLNMANPNLRLDNGQFAHDAVSAGMLFMIPFTVLAVLAQFVLSWNAVMPFASAAIMTSAATAGTEVMKKGAQGIKNVIIPSVVAFLLSTGWMLLIGLLP
ncbi:MAG: hypothetical protein PHO01_08480 [Desulfotomaculaceae bacterium]|nr:hypothetical protein [Desulfotomaculaceae bacterium]